MRFIVLFRRREQRERELDEEIHAHLAMAIRERIERGENPSEAESNARREFGNATLVKEVTRDMWGWRWLETLLQDMRYGLRQLRRNPGFTAVAVLSLALGIGATIAIFSIMYALAFRRLPVQRPDELVEVVRAGGGNLHTYALWKLFRDRQDILSSAFAYNYFDTDFEVANSKGRQEVSGLYVSGDYFSGLGVSAVFGRVLRSSDDRPGGPPVCVIGYGLWRQLYGQSRDVLGQAIRVNGHKFQIVGVAPRSFFGLEIDAHSEIFMPLEAERTYRDYPLLYGRQTPLLDDPHATLVSIFGRLKAGESVSQASAGLQVLSPEMYRALPRFSDHDRPSSMPGPLVASPIPNGTSIARLQDMDVLVLLMAMAAVALVIGCANLGNLLLARAAKRRSEIATRLALGAARWRLVRQLLTESVVLSVIGAAAGLIIARWGSAVLLWALSFPGMPILLDLSWDAKLAVFAVSITLSCALLSGLAPAIAATDVSLYSAMNSGGTTGKRKNRFMNSGLVIVQVALSVAVLFNASLLTRTLQALLAQDPGYDPKGVLVASATWQGPDESAQHQAFVGEELLRQFRSLPGVISASWNRTFSKMRGPQLVVPGPSGSEKRSSSYPIFVSSDSFMTDRTPILAGRDFNDTDTSIPVAILNEDLAKALFPGLNPVGLTFRENDGNGNGHGYSVEVVGIVRDVNYRQPSDGPLPLLYRPVSQCGHLCLGVGGYEIRVAGALPEMTKRLKNLAAIVDPHIVLKCEPLMDTIYNGVHRNRAMALIAMTFGLFVSVLALIGVYGVTSYVTAERTREIGIRMALGAERGAVFRMLLGEMMGVVCIGIAFGVGAAFVAAGLIRGMIWGVKPTDPLSFGFAICLMLSVGGIAALLPARRAATVDPMEALRYE